MISKAKPGMTTSKLKPLVEAGLVVLEQRGRPKHIVLTDRAWQWAEENLTAEFSTRANNTPALQGLLFRLKNYLKQTGTPLAELLTAEMPPPAAIDAPSIPEPLVAPAPPALPPIEGAIREAYLALSGGQWETRVRLAGLRQHLGAYPRPEQDRALLRLQSAGLLVLYRLDDPQDTFDVDREAALYLGNDPRHLVYMKG